MWYKILDLLSLHYKTRKRERKKIKAYNNQHTKTCPQSGALQVKATDYEFNHVKNDRQTMSLNAHKISTRHTTDAFSVTFGGDRHFCVTPVRLLRRVTSTSWQCDAELSNSKITVIEGVHNLFFFSPSCPPLLSDVKITLKGTLPMPSTLISVGFSQSKCTGSGIPEADRSRIRPTWPCHEVSNVTYDNRLRYSYEPYGTTDFTIAEGTSGRTSEI